MKFFWLTLRLLSSFWLIVIIIKLWLEKRKLKNNNDDTIHEEKLINYSNIQKYVKFILFFLGIKVKVLFPENISKKAVLIVSNHLTILDMLFIMHAFSFEKKSKPIAMLAKKELKKNLLVKLILGSAEVIFLDRNDVRQALECMNNAKHLINYYNFSLLVFPEGTRNKTNNLLLEFKPGAFKVAKLSACPIQPVVIFPEVKRIAKFNLFTRQLNLMILKPINFLKHSHIKTVHLAKIMFNLMQKELNNERILNNKKNKSIVKQND